MANVYFLDDDLNDRLRDVGTAGRLTTLAIEGAPIEDHQPTFVIRNEERGLGPAERWLVDRFRLV